MIIKHKQPEVYLKKWYWYIKHAPRPNESEHQYLLKVKIDNISYRYSSAGKEFMGLEIAQENFEYTNELTQEDVNSCLWETKKQARFAVLKMSAKHQQMIDDNIAMFRSMLVKGYEVQDKLTRIFNKKYNKGKSKCSI